MPFPEDRLLSSYHYELDSRQIAQRPVEPRHSARLLVVDKCKGLLSEGRHLTVWDLQSELRAGDLLVLNDTRVIKARLTVRRSGGGLSELFLLEPLNRGRWVCLARPAKRLRPGDSLWAEAPGQQPVELKVISKEPETGGRVVQFPTCFFDRRSIEQFLTLYGQVPLPPYIHTQDSKDEERYQTCYASSPGAVAAPTAGLHLSHELLKELDLKGVNQTRVTLHVGLGTFRPLEKQDLTDLELHREWVEVGEDVVKAVFDCQKRGGRVIAVGTTSVRAIEGAFSIGNGKLVPYMGYIDLVIKPGFRFGVIDGLLTNFHLPQSSLLLLVSALIGRERLLALYSEAIKKHYRFFSYGDAMLVSPEAVISEARKIT